MKKNPLNQCHQRSLLSSCELSPKHSKVLPEPLNTFKKNNDDVKFYCTYPE